MPLPAQALVGCGELEPVRVDGPDRNVRWETITFWNDVDVTVWPRNVCAGCRLNWLEGVVHIHRWPVAHVGQRDLAFDGPNSHITGDAARFQYRVLSISRAETNC